MLHVLSWKVLHQITALKPLLFHMTSGLTIFSKKLCVLG